MVSKNNFSGEDFVNFHEYSPEVQHRSFPFGALGGKFSGKDLPLNLPGAEFCWVDKQRGEHNPLKTTKNVKFSPGFFGPKKCCQVFSSPRKSNVTFFIGLIISAWFQVGLYHHPEGNHRFKKWWQRLRLPKV